MPARKIPRWTEAEIEVLRTVYVQHGLQAAQQKLPDRAGQSIYVKANKLGLHTNHRPARLGVYRHIGPEALRLYAELGSYTAVARCLGVCEATATNAVHFERNCQSCNEPLERGLDGRFTRSAIDRLRQLFRKGLTHRDIQLLTGVSAGTLTRERRRYEEYLKERKLAPIPARNHGEAYSGNLVPKSSKREVEQLYLEGFGAKKITERTGVSHTVCLRIRAKLLRRLKRAGKCLPGCDLDGTRRVMRDHARHIPAETAARLRKMLLSGFPVSRAAKICGIGGSTAYRIRDAMKAELGDAMPKPRLPGRTSPLQRELMADQQIPKEKLQRFRTLVHEHGDEHARRLLRAEIATERRSMTFEQQLEAVGQGKARLVANRHIRRPDPAFSPGGSQLAGIA